MKKICIITTGGTIAMREDREAGGLVPAVSGEELAAPRRASLTGRTLRSGNFPISPANS